jgi:acetyl-CoA carboxylase biotin carboxyl carrier protein
MDLRKIRKLIEIFNASKLSEIEIREGEESIRLTRTPVIVADHQLSHTATPAIESSVHLEDIQEDDDEMDDTFPVLSPMVGTFFSSASPDADPFVKVGDQVELGQPLCIIEAMKLFNSIEADRSGSIVKVFKENGDPVEFGEPLFLLSE